MNTGERIAFFRKERGLTQKELANRMKLATGTIQQYELSKRVPNKNIIKAISEELGVRESDLYDFDENNEKFDCNVNIVLAKNILEKSMGSDSYSVMRKAIDDAYKILKKIDMKEIEE